MLIRAVEAWQASRPHTAWTILAEAGMAELWPHFQRAMLRHNRTRFTRTMTRTR